RNGSTACVDCAPGSLRLTYRGRFRGWPVTKVLSAVGVVALTAAFSLLGQPLARADPDTCPPHCDRIPASAWIDSAAIPLDAKYAWPNLAGVAVFLQRPRFRFEEMCA